MFLMDSKWYGFADSQPEALGVMSNNTIVDVEVPLHSLESLV